jgi:hypothetical protein
MFYIRRSPTRFVFLALVALAPAAMGFSDNGPLGLVINEDDSHFYTSRPAEKMTVEGLQALVDGYVGTQVSQIFFNANSQRTAYRSAVWTPIWEGNNPEKTDNKWVHNAWLLDQKGINPFLVWIARCREKGISPWISMRMNDVHEANDVNSYIHGRFWKEHPQYWRIPSYAGGGWIEKSLDYAHPEVREYNMALIREYLELFDMDGLELDWMRFGYHFKPGYEEEGRKLLIEFTRQVRELTNQWSAKRGHPIKLAARVPATPEYAYGLGLDGAAWAREGLIDMLIPTPFFLPADFDIPMEQWRELLGPASKNVVLAAGMEQHIRGNPKQDTILNDAETMRGFTAAMLHRGADQIYLFNHMDSETTVASESDYRKILTEAARLDTVLDKPRRHILTYHDTVPPGVPKPSLLPLEIGKSYEQFRLYAGPKPEKGQVIIRAGLGKRDGVEKARLKARINLAECSPLPDGKALHVPKELARVVQFAVPIAAAQDGYNLIELGIVEGGIQNVEWLEVYIDPGGSAR